MKKYQSSMKRACHLLIVCCFNITNQTEDKFSSFKMTSVAVLMVLQVFLMFLFGGKIVFERLDRGRDGVWPLFRFFYFTYYCLCREFILFIFIKNYRSIGSTNIVALTIFGSRIVYTKKITQ